MAARNGALVILPCGCTEQHAWHLPVDTDTYQVERLCHDAAQRAGEQHGLQVLVLPRCPSEQRSSTTRYPPHPRDSSLLSITCGVGVSKPSSVLQKSMLVVDARCDGCMPTASVAAVSGQTTIDS
jgi:hypothetical protein